MKSTYNMFDYKIEQTNINSRMEKIAQNGLSKKEREIFDFWIDKKVPYDKKEHVPVKFQHDNQFYEKTKKVNKLYCSQ